MDRCYYAERFDIACLLLHARITVCSEALDVIIKFSEKASIFHSWSLFVLIAVSLYVQGWWLLCFLAIGVVLNIIYSKIFDKLTIKSDKIVEDAFLASELMDEIEPLCNRTSVESWQWEHFCKRNSHRLTQLGIKVT